MMRTYTSLVGHVILQLKTDGGDNHTGKKLQNRCGTKRKKGSHPKM